MTMPEQVQLQDLSAESARLLVQKSLGIHLGDAAAERRVSKLLARIQRGARAFLLDWEGSKIPRGVCVSGHEIGWTQHGNVTATGGRIVGTYDRIVEFGGASGQHQQMIIYINR